MRAAKQTPRGTRLETVDGEQPTYPPAAVMTHPSTLRAQHRRLADNWLSLWFLWASIRQFGSFPAMNQDNRKKASGLLALTGIVVMLAPILYFLSLGPAVYL